MQSPKRIDFKSLLTLANEQQMAKLPFVLYRHPKECLVYAMFQDDKKSTTTKDFDSTGFVFAPFDLKSPGFLLRPDRFFASEFVPSTKVEEKAVIPTEMGREAHLELVDRALKAIRKDGLNKIVVSRVIESNDSANSLAVFVKALERYDNTFCYLWSHHETETWIGATPERLITKVGDEVQTTALAGTLPYKEGQKPNWTFKEREEQQMVTDFLLNQLKDYVYDYQIGPTHSFKAGKLWHLKTDIKGKLKHNNELKTIIDKIHPTSAVCGQPKQQAKEFIVANEGYRREFYTGYLGTLNLDGKTALFVNLRCMKISSEKVNIYVGGGITSSSKADDEWVETQNKSKTMLSLI